ncbi:acetyltransferase [Rubidibacter lacunae KORDI 51-2]|uniref:Acetyltransferase n=1 Tax=Rubidibacter lacunae KORDI 51-2 TaxID=582515 RepID=U5DKH6_9CHRO|nr:GNAT family N-acetyltransferase [Rubidibacter lacunae]ERN41069.1 acetyltransferase [Rubidibacter lacunae KORDI 51-2]
MPSLPFGYHLRSGSGRDRALLVKFMQQTYEELFPDLQDFSHLAQTVERYWSPQTPLWWVVTTAAAPAACAWAGTAVDQVSGDRYTHLFLLYVAADHRRRGIGTLLLAEVLAWARARGDRQVGLQVFADNQPALSLYERLGFRTQSLLMLKPVNDAPDRQ